MAIYHCSMKPVSRASGRSAVASAAYRSAERLTNERDGITHDFRTKQGVEHAEIVLPQGVDVDWARDRSTLWNAAELAEKRKDGRVAREFEIALPHELSAEQRLELTRAFAQDLADRHGTAVDFAIHQPHSASDVRNHHAHLLMTTRAVTAEGLADKATIERENKWLLANDMPTSQMQLRDIRQAWEHHANEHLARAGLDIRIDHRSHMERGLEITPTEHMGVHATQMDRRGLDVSRTRLDEDAAQRNAELIRQKPEQVLTLITNEKSVFDRHDVARTLHRYINDDAQAFQNAFSSVMASPALVELQPASEKELARYSTREMVEIESGIAASAEQLHQARTHGVDRRHVEHAIGRQDEAIRSSVATDMAGKVDRGELDAQERERRIETARLSDEQRHAIAHITGPERIAAVVGYAGAGKSTMLAAAREAWEAQGYQVHGAALSGKAAEGLEESSGIQSRTLASWEYGWQAGKGEIGRGDVFVIDEAGMVGSRQLARFVGEAEKAGAKIVLVGDHEQVQAIGAGAPFRAIAEQIGHAELSEIRRQRVDWQREASVSFATHRTAEGLAAYGRHGDIRFSETRDDARATIVRDYLADRDERPEGTRVAMAHRRVDVRAINAEIRNALQERGELARGNVPGGDQGALGRELTFQTNDGKRAFAPGDRIVFLQNDRDLGVKNGTLGTVEAVEPGLIHTRLDGAARSGEVGARAISVRMNDYNAIDHGYATTIHKNQGATVDRSFVLSSGTMDRHLTYVAMTRHRDGAQLYAGRDEFKDGKALSSRLSRAGVKETTLDYTSDFAERQFAERRGIAERMGVRSEIEIPRDREHTRTERQTRQPRMEAEKGGEDLAPDHGDDRRQGQRRSRFESLKLSRGAAAESRQPRAGAEIAQERPQRAEQRPRGMFDGLQLHADRRASQEPLERPEREGSLRLSASGWEASAQAKPEQERQSDRLRPLSGFERSVDRFARAWTAAERMERDGLPVLDSQKAELRDAGLELDQARPGSARLMVSAMRHDPETARVMNELSGRERVGQLVGGMDRERAMQADPNVRAERFVQRWQDFDQQRQQLRGWQHDEARGKVEGQMRGMAKGLERDPQVESILRNRSQDLGISHIRREQNIAQEMERSLTRGRSLGLER